MSKGDFQNDLKKYSVNIIVYQTYTNPYTTTTRTRYMLEKYKKVLEMNPEDRLLRLRLENSLLSIGSIVY